MTLNIETILYATDLSDNARYAYGYANDLARKYNARITILYVIENINPTIEIQISGMLGNEKWDQVIKENEAHLDKYIRERVETFCHELDSEYDACRLTLEDIMIARGVPHEQIVNASKQMDADLIVMGTHGHNLLKDVMIGSTARKVVKYSEKPVLTVKLP